VTMQVDLSFGRANFVLKDFSKTNTYSFNTTLHRGTEWCKDLKVENVVSRYKIKYFIILFSVSYF
jgi:hypothetical protein